MKRYSMFIGIGKLARACVDPHESPDGEWVRYEDVAVIRETLEMAVGTMEAALADARRSGRDEEADLLLELLNNAERVLKDTV